MQAQLLMYFRLNVRCDAKSKTHVYTRKNAFRLKVRPDTKSKTHSLQGKMHLDLRFGLTLSLKHILYKEKCI